MRFLITCMIITTAFLAFVLVYTIYPGYESVQSQLAFLVNVDESHIRSLLSPGKYFVFQLLLGLALIIVCLLIYYEKKINYYFIKFYKKCLELLQILFYSARHSLFL